MWARMKVLKENEIEGVFGEITPVNSSNLDQYKDLHVYQTPNKNDHERSLPENIIFKFSAVKEKHNILKFTQDQYQILFSVPTSN